LNKKGLGLGTFKIDEALSSIEHTGGEDAPTGERAGIVLKKIDNIAKKQQIPL
jgi:hypothetical protein